MSDAITKYLLDTSVLIEASKRYYAPDLVATFWDSLAYQSQAGIISSIDKVKAEIHDRNTFLIDWANNEFRRWDSTANENTGRMYRKLITWSRLQQQYNEKVKDEFADDGKADAWLVAHASVSQRVVVTEEVFNSHIQRKIPIPNVCIAFNVRYIDTFQMLRELQINLTGQE